MDGPTYMLPRPPAHRPSVKNGYFQAMYNRTDTKRHLIANMTNAATTDVKVMKRIMAIKVRMNFITNKDIKIKKENK